MNKNKILLITGCVNVSKEMCNVFLIDSNERWEQYKETLRWAIEDTAFDVIVFCENSGFQNEDIRSFEMAATSCGKKFEYITYVADKELNDRYGKGYGEGELVKHAVHNSKYISLNSSFYKITGKLVVKNINKIIGKSDTTHFMKAYKGIGVDTRFYQMNLEDYYRCFEDAYKFCNDKKREILEVVYADVIQKNSVRATCFSRFPVVVGRSGSNGSEYSMPKTWVCLVYDLMCRIRVYNTRVGFLVYRCIRKINYIGSGKWEKR